MPGVSPITPGSDAPSSARTSACTFDDASSSSADSPNGVTLARAVLDALDAIAGLTGRDIDFDDVAHGAVLQRAADRRLDRDTPIARIHLARTNQRVIE